MQNRNIFLTQRRRDAECAEEVGEKSWSWGVELISFFVEFHLMPFPLLLPDSRSRYHSHGTLRADNGCQARSPPPMRILTLSFLLAYPLLPLALKLYHTSRLQHFVSLWHSHLYNFYCVTPTVCHRSHPLLTQLTN